MSQKGISDLYDTYLRIIEQPKKYNSNHKYIQGKLPVVVKSSTKSTSNTMADVAVPVEDLTIELEEESDNDGVSEVKWVNEILCFVDCDHLKNLDADVYVNSKSPAKLTTHATSAAKVERSQIKLIRNLVNKVFNNCSNLICFEACQKDFESPLIKFNVFPYLMEIANALKFIFGVVCKMKNVKSNRLYDRLHDTLKNSRHNKATKLALANATKETEAAASRRNLLAK